MYASIEMDMNIAMDFDWFEMAQIYAVDGWTYYGFVLFFSVKQWQ